MVLVLDGFDAQSLGFLAPSIAKSLRVPVNTFGPIFGVALFGLMIAAMISGLIADRWGRKWPIIISALTFGAFTVLTARATSFHELLLFRFLTGLGLGGAMPNVVSLTSEYAPKRLVFRFCKHALLRHAHGRSAGWHSRGGDAPALGMAIGSFT